MRDSADAAQERKEVDQVQRLIDRTLWAVLLALAAVCLISTEFALAETEPRSPATSTSEPRRLSEQKALDLADKLLSRALGEQPSDIPPEKADALSGSASQPQPASSKSAAPPLASTAEGENAADLVPEETTGPGALPEAAPTGTKVAKPSAGATEAASASIMSPQDKAAASVARPNGGSPLAKIAAWRERMLVGQASPSNQGSATSRSTRAAQHMESLPPGAMHQPGPPAPMQRPQLPGMAGQSMPASGYPTTDPGASVGQPHGGYFPGSNDWQPYHTPNVVPSGPPQQCPVGCCCAECGGGEACPTQWFMEQGVWVAYHSRPRGTFVTQNLNTGQLRNTRLLNFDITTGYQLNVGRYLGRDTSNRDHTIEFGYKGMNTWFDSYAENGQLLTLSGDDPVSFGELFTFFGETFAGYDSPITGFNRATRQEMFYKSRYDSFEFNMRIRPRGRKDRLVLHPNGRWRRECQTGCFPSYLVGFRFFSLDEEFGLFGRSVVINDEGTFRGTGDYIINTHNDMIGFQIGGDMLWRECLWDWGIRYKLGPLINFSDQRSTITTTGAAGDPFSTNDLDIYRAAKNDGLAAFADIGVFASYKLRPNCIVRAGWDWMWIVGLALAPEQVDFDTNAVPRVNDNGVVFLQGFTATLEMNW